MQRGSEWCPGPSLLKAELEGEPGSLLHQVAHPLDGRGSGLQSLGQAGPISSWDLLGHLETEGAFQRSSPCSAGASRVDGLAWGLGCLLQLVRAPLLSIWLL